MGKSIIIIAVGVFLVFMGCRTMGGTDTEIEHLYEGRTETVVCSGGQPTDGVGLDARTAIEACADEKSRQTGATRVMFVLGLMAIGYGAFEARKAKQE